MTKKRSFKEAATRKKVGVKQAPRKKAQVRKVVKQQPLKKVPVRKASVRKAVKPQHRKKGPARKAPVRKEVKPRPSKKVPVLKAPVRKAVKPPPRKKVPVRKAPVRKAVKPQPRKKAPARPLPKKRRGIPPQKKLPKRKKPPKKARKPKRRFPTFMAAAVQAEALMQEKLASFGDLLIMSTDMLEASVKSFINKDGTVDGELRVGNLPAEWTVREGLPAMIATVMESLRGVGAFPAAPAMGGAFWVSFGLRFGPKDMTDIGDWAKAYKRFKGLFQIGAHHTTAQSLSAILNNAMAFRMFVDRVWEKRGVPPVQMLVRFVWTPTKTRPGRFAGEEGSSK